MRVDLERLDETYEDLADWPDVDDRGVRDERAARAALYGARSGAVTAAPALPSINDETPGPLAPARGL